jgi:hypothetical protein
MTNRCHDRLNLAGAALIAVALLLVMNPEARILMMFVDSIGVDLFALLVALYGRHHVSLCVSILLVPTLKYIYRLGPVPGFWPSKSVIRSGAWAGYAVLYPAAAASLAALCIKCLLAP